MRSGGGAAMGRPRGRSRSRGRAGAGGGGGGGGGAGAGAAGGGGAGGGAPRAGRTRSKSRARGRSRSCSEKSTRTGGGEGGTPGRTRSGGRAEGSGRSSGHQKLAGRREAGAGSWLRGRAGRGAAPPQAPGRPVGGRETGASARGSPPRDYLRLATYIGGALAVTGGLIAKLAPPGGASLPRGGAPLHPLGDPPPGVPWGASACPEEVSLAGFPAEFRRDFVAGNLTSPATRAWDAPVQNELHTQLRVLQAEREQCLARRRDSIQVTDMEDDDEDEGVRGAEDSAAGPRGGKDSEGAREEGDWVRRELGEERLDGSRGGDEEQCEAVLGAAGAEEELELTGLLEPPQSEPRTGYFEWPLAEPSTALAIPQPKVHPNPALRFFASDNTDQRNIAVDLFQSVEGLPLVCPHANFAPELIGEESGHDSGVKAFGDPVEIFIRNNHPALRLLQSQGLPLEKLGVLAGGEEADVETDPRQIWQTFAENFHRLRGTPSNLWIREAFRGIFRMNEILNGRNAQRLYDRILTQLNSKEFTPLAVFQSLNVEVLCTTESATSNLTVYRDIYNKTGSFKLRPTFLPDRLFNLRDPHWKEEVQLLGEMTGIAISSYNEFVDALQVRRGEFKELGAVSTDHETAMPVAKWRTIEEMESYFQAAMSRREITRKQEANFQAHMLMEMARMSTQDRLVMQLHTGIHKGHDKRPLGESDLFSGIPRLQDMPAASDFSGGLQELLNEFGHHPNFTLVLFTPDESTYTRELGPLAGHYPAVRVGAPWWFLSSPRAMRKYLTEIVEVAGIHNLAGFNDDAGMLLSMPLKHALWRRVISNWAAGLVVQGEIAYQEALQVVYQLAYAQAKLTYNL